MTVWLAIAVIMIVVTLGVSGCLAYILISLSRTAPLLGARVGVGHFQVVRMSDAPHSSRRARRPQPRLRPITITA
jgi:hypothetical protein